MSGTTEQRFTMNAENYRAAVVKLAQEIPAGALYPPEMNFTAGQCYTCRHPVPPHQGVFTLGRSDEWTAYGAHLHRDCAADVRQAQEGAQR